jgi:hypothetical protein
MTGKTIAAQTEARIKKAKALESVFKNKILLIDSSTCLQPPFYSRNSALCLSHFCLIILYFGVRLSGRVPRSSLSPAMLYGIIYRSLIIVVVLGFDAGLTRGGWLSKPRYHASLCCATETGPITFSIYETVSLNFYVTISISRYIKPDKLYPPISEGCAAICHLIYPKRSPPKCEEIDSSSGFGTSSPAFTGANKVSRLGLSFSVSHRENGLWAVGPIHCSRGPPPLFEIHLISEHDITGFLSAHLLRS